MTSCCKCGTEATGTGSDQAFQLICVLPQDSTIAHPSRSTRPSAAGTNDTQNFRLLDPDYIKKHFKLPPPPLYLDPFRRPLITFPTSGDKSKHFTMARKTKINQMILDGFLDPSEAIKAPCVFPHAKEEAPAADEEDDVVYILQIPKLGSTIRIPRSIFKTCDKSKEVEEGEMKRGGGPLHKPKPWLLSRHTDFDYMSQW